MKTINIQNEANIKAKGEHGQKNAKAVICIETGEVYVSAFFFCNLNLYSL